VEGTHADDVRHLTGNGKLCRYLSEREAIANEPTVEAAACESLMSMIQLLFELGPDVKQGTVEIAKLYPRSELVA
jgi:hypothetical protein